MGAQGGSRAILLAGLALLCAVAGDRAFAGSECGIASWYGLTGQTASGEYIKPDAMTAAHRTLPFGTRVRLDNLDNGKSIVVRINDRGPFVPGRMIDVTRPVAKKLDFTRSGLAHVRMTVVGGGRALPDRGCGGLVASNDGAIDAVPLPRVRPESPSSRFAFDFAIADQAAGATRVAIVLAARLPRVPGPAKAGAVERPDAPFVQRFGSAFTSSGRVERASM